MDGFYWSRLWDVVLVRGEGKMDGQGTHECLVVGLVC